MCFRCLGFVLLVWLPGVVNAQSGTVTCDAPQLDGGYFVPEQVSYSHTSKLTYACDTGLKPAVEGWWAMSECQNGKWSHKPQCIDEKSCFKPDIPNAEFTENPNGWYKESEKIRITCDKGHAPKDYDATAECKNGSWTSIPICEKSRNACDTPPKMRHAVIIHQGYQDLFDEDSNVIYECENGYAVEGGADKQKVLHCLGGNWTAGQPCKGGDRPADGHHGGTASGGHGSSDGGRGTASGGHGTADRGHGTASGGHGSSDGGRGTASGGHGSADGGRGTASGGHGSADGGRGTASGGHGTADGGRGTASGSGTQPAGGGDRGGGRGASSGSSSHNGPLITTVDQCGAVPNVMNGDVLQTNRMSLKYQCSAFYKLVGAADVVCYSDGSWSDLPTCKEAYCVVRTADYPELQQLNQDIYLQEGGSQYFACPQLDYWGRSYHSLAQCINGRIHFKFRCCSPWKIQYATRTC